MKLHYNVETLQRRSGLSGVWAQTALIIPAVVLGAGSWLRHVPGEWSRAALLAWSIVVYAFLVGLLAPAAMPVTAVMAALLGGFAALAVGGTYGLAAAATLLLVLAILTAAGMSVVPILPCLVTALAAGLAALRGRIGG